MADHRLGDVIDDYCIKCRRLTNHSIVSIVNAEAAKVRCRTCYHDHDFRHEIAPPTKKELKKAEMLLNEAQAASGAAASAADGEPLVAVAEAPPVEEALVAADSGSVSPAPASSAKKARKGVKR